MGAVLEQEHNVNFIKCFAALVPELANCLTAFKSCRRDLAISNSNSRVLSDKVSLCCCHGELRLRSNAAKKSALFSRAFEQRRCETIGQQFICSYSLKHS